MAKMGGKGKAAPKAAALVKKTITKITKPAKSGGDDKPDDEPRMVYIGNLPFKAEWQELKDHMKQAGEVEFASVIANDQGRSKGVGCVRYSTEEEAQQAIAMLNGSELMGKEISVDVWTGPKPYTNKGGMAITGKGMKKGGMAMMPMGGKGKGGGKNVSEMWNMFQMWMGATPQPMPMMMMPMGAMGGGKSKGKGRGKNVHGDKSCMIFVGNLAKGVEWQELKDHCKQVGSVEFVNVTGKTGQVRFATEEEAQSAIAQLNGSELMGQAIEVDVWN